LSKNLKKILETLTIDDINEIIEYKIKIENINSRQEIHKIKNKFIRCFYLYRNYEFNIKTLVDMSNDRWIHFKRQLETL
jgi:hypothetical protein